MPSAPRAQRSRSSAHCRAQPQERWHWQAGAQRPHRPRHRTGGGRCGGRDFRRRRQHRGAGAGAGRAGRGPGHRAGAAPGRRPVCRRGARQPRAQGRAGAGDAVPARPRERRRPPLGRAPAHAARRPRRGNRDAHAALGAGAAGRRAIGADRRRAGLGQVPPDRGISRPAARHAAYLGGMELLAASAEHAAASDRRMGPPALRRRRRTRRAAACRPGEFARPGQARSGGECPVTRAAPRHSAAAGPRAGSGARGVAAPAIGGADQLGAGGRKSSAGGAGVRGSALGRSDHARRAARHCRARRARASVRRGDDAARIPRRPGACARITAPSRWRRSIARRCATWWRSFPPATRCRRRWWRMSPRAPVACRCSSRK